MKEVWANSNAQPIVLDLPMKFRKQANGPEWQGSPGNFRGPSPQRGETATETENLPGTGRFGWMAESRRHGQARHDGGDPKYFGFVRAAFGSPSPFLRLERPVDSRHSADFGWRPIFICRRNELNHKDTRQPKGQRQNEKLKMQNSEASAFPWLHGTSWWDKGVRMGDRDMLKHGLHTRMGRAKAGALARVNEVSARLNPVPPG
jgi:hypothetical protein